MAATRLLLARLTTQILVVSKFFGKALAHGVVDTHVVAVSQSKFFQAADGVRNAYLELVTKDRNSLLPLGVLWLRRN